MGLEGEPSVNDNGEAVHKKSPADIFSSP